MRSPYYTRIALIVLSFLFITSPLDAAPGSKYLVTAVHDGDTVSVRVRDFAGVPLRIEKVRLIGIDAPEIRQEPWGRKAKKHLKELVKASNWVVILETDQQERDQYGRLLGYLWSARDGSLINEKMIRDGFAVLFTFPPNVKYADRFTDAQKRAQEQQTGIWSAKGLRKSPSSWRREHPEYRP